MLFLRYLKRNSDVRKSLILVFTGGKEYNAENINAMIMNSTL